jgi:hypothetical protein
MMPAALGDVRIRISLSKDGTVTLQLVETNPEGLIANALRVGQHLTERLG